MIENHYLAGALAGSLVSVLSLTYVLLRRDTVVTALTTGRDRLPEAAATVLAFGAAAFLGPLLGVVAAAVFDRMASEPQYMLFVFGLATLMSAAALVGKAPLLGEKIVLNYAVALALGLLMPRLIAG